MTDQEIAKRLIKRDLRVFEYIMDHYNKLLWLVAGNVLEEEITNVEQLKGLNLVIDVCDPDRKRNRHCDQ